MSEEDKKNAALADEHSENTEQGQPADPGKLNHYSGRSEEAVRATPEEYLIEKAGRESEEHVQAGNGGGHPSAAVAVGPGSHAHGHAPGHAHAHDASHGLAHTTPVPLLLGVLGVLMVLTVITVLVTRVDLGAQGNLIVAMVIATIKAALVVSFFMHLVWDKKLHLILFMTSVLFVILFLSMSTADRSEYQESIDYFQQTGQP